MVARRAHNPEVVGSNPAPATNYSQTLRGLFSYRGAIMTLENKLGITDPIALAHEEERISKAEALGMYADGTLEALKPGSLSALVAIHERLFGGLYDFAGKIRTVNLAKGGFRFAPALYLAQALRAVEAMPQGTFDQVAEKYVEMNVARSVDVSYAYEGYAAYRAAEL